MTITGSNTQFSHCTYGMSLHLQSAANGQIYNFGQGTWSGGWCTTTDDTLASGNINLPGNAPLGQYHVRIQGFGMYGQLLDHTEYNLLTVLGNGAYYEGKVVFDWDSSCTQNGMDFGARNHIVTANPGGYQGITDNQGNFRMFLPVGSYTFSIAPPSGSQYLCPASPYTQTASAAVIGDTARGIDFYVKPNHLADAAVHVVVGPHRPGFNTNWFAFHVDNLGSAPAANITAKLVLPTGFTLTSSNMGPASTNGDTVTWVRPSLAPFSQLTISGMVHVPQNVNPLTPFTYHASVTTTSQQSNVLNDTASAHGLVTSSLDPNDKQVWTMDGADADGFIDPSVMRLRYLIRFQNTGTDTAFNISVADMLDSRLDPATLQVEATSGTCNVVSLDSTGRNLRFEFPNVMLPDSNVNEPASHGYVQYSIDRDAGLSNGTSIANTARIYFDFNPAVITNTVISRICPELGGTFTSNVNQLQVAFTAPSTGTPTTWAWNFGDGQTDVTANPTHTYDSAGAYTVCLQIGNACGRTRTICATVYVGVTGMQPGSGGIHSIALSPNPANREVKVQLEADKLTHPRFRLIDIHGRCVRTWEARTIIGKYEQQLSVEDLPTGLYFLHIQAQETMHTVKLMVE